MAGSRITKCCYILTAVLAFHALLAVCTWEQLAAFHACDHSATLLAWGKLVVAIQIHQTDHSSVHDICCTQISAKGALPCCSLVDIETDETRDQKLRPHLINTTRDVSGCLGLLLKLVLSPILRLPAACQSLLLLERRHATGLRS